MTEFNFQINQQIRCRNDPVFVIGCNYAVIVGEIDPGPGYQGSEAGDEIQRYEDHMGGSIAVGCFEFVAYFAMPGQYSWTTWQSKGVSGRWRW